MNKFNSKKSLKDHLSVILHQGSIGIITDDNTIDILFKLVEQSQPKKLIDFDHFEIDNDNFRSRCFYVCDKDNNKVDFSYNWVIRSYSPLSKRKRLPNHIVYMIQSARGSINRQINQWRLDNNISANFQIDHYPEPFSKILFDWYVEQDDIKIPSIQLDNNMWIIAPSHEQSWLDYHSEIARYRPIDKLQNSKNGSYGFNADWYHAINLKINK
jgi:hypothetical protein